MKSQKALDQCRATAADYGKLAEQAADPVRKSEYEVLQKRWLKLTTRYELQERADNSTVLPFIQSKTAGANPASLTPGENLEPHCLKPATRQSFSTNRERARTEPSD
jgi:hypothetical protein